MTKITTNYHTHTTFCDGAQTPEQMVKAALEKGFTQLGFSAHAMYPYGSIWHLPIQKYSAYVEEINRLKKEYESKIRILLGFEADFFLPLTKPDKALYSPNNPDFLIGSVHYLAVENKGCFCIDASTEEITNGLRTLFKGNAKKMVCEYFEAQRQMALTCDFDIIGHADVVRKRNKNKLFFDENESWYKRELKQTAKVFAKSGKIVEINSGGIVRAAMSDVYPSYDFLCELKKYNVPVTFCSDAHKAEYLDTEFDFAAESAKKAGYSEYVIFEKKNHTLGLKTVRL